MSTELQQRLLRRREEKEAAALPDRLPALHCLGFRETADVLADPLAATMREVHRTDSRPDATHPDDDGVADWVRDFVAAAGIGDHFFLGTGFAFFPWLECEVSGPEWVGQVLEVLGGDLRIVSADRSVLVVVLDEEHDVQAFRRTS